MKLEHRTLPSRLAGWSTLLSLVALQAACGGGGADAEDAAAFQRPAGQAAAPWTAPQAQAADTIDIEVGCCEDRHVDEAVGLVWALQAAHDLPRSVPVRLHGADLHLATAAARRLADGGLTHVWVVRP